MEKSPLRLQKYFTDCGVLSRRAAEAEIRQGRVRVNGAVAEIGQQIDPEADVVTWRGKRVVPTAKAHHYILLNKPRGFVTTLSDEKGRQTVADLVASLGVRLYPVGRLDMDSDGMLILTDDGALTNALTHPRHEIPKYYRVTVKGAVDEGALKRLNGSFCLDGYNTLPAKVEVLGTEGSNTLLLVELFEGRNRQIRRMCEQVGLSILRLTRVGIGILTLGNLKEGTYRHLTRTEVEYLIKASKKAP